MDPNNTQPIIEKKVKEEEFKTENESKYNPNKIQLKQGGSNTSIDMKESTKFDFDIGNGVNYII